MSDANDILRRHRDEMALVDDKLAEQMDGFRKDIAKLIIKVASEPAPQSPAPSNDGGTKPA